MRHPRCFAAVLSGLVLLIALCPYSIEAAKPVKRKSGKRATVRLGIIQTLFRDTPEPLMQILMRPFKNLMEEQAGVHSVLARASDSFGRVQPAGRARNRLGYRWNVIHAIQVHVA